MCKYIGINKDKKYILVFNLTYYQRNRCNLLLGEIFNYNFTNLSIVVLLAEGCFFSTHFDTVSLFFKIISKNKF